MKEGICFYGLTEVFSAGAYQKHCAQCEEIVLSQTIAFEFICNFKQVCTSVRREDGAG